MTPEPLDALRRALDSFRVTECRISHERVLFQSGVASRRHANGVAVSFVRVGLCPWEDRERALACAHTTSRYRLVAVAEALAAHLLIEKEEARQIAEHVDQLANTIHATDWSKGELEAAYAVAVETGAPDAEDIRARIEGLESVHTAASRALQAVLEHLRDVIRGADVPTQGS